MLVHDIQTALRNGTHRLRHSDSPRADCEILLAHIIDRNRTYLYTWPDQMLTEQQIIAFEFLLKRRIEGEPIAHILGYKEFWGLTLKCDASTLIPRPDTEILIETVLDLDLPNQGQGVDLGTGTGAIVLALASEKPNWLWCGIDLSPGAVNLAQENQQRLGLDNVVIREGNWLEGFSENSIDLIVSNPPYIDRRDPHLDQGDVRFEPRSALVAANHGLQDIQVLTEQARQCLVSGGYLLFEHGYDQKDACKDIILASGLEYLRCVQDYGGNDRVTVARKTI